MSIKKIKFLMYNPFFLGQIFINFLQGYDGPCNYKIFLYILPLIMVKQTRIFLSSANTRSTLESIFSSKKLEIYGVEISKNIELINFADGYNYFKNLTNEVIIILYNEGELIYDDKGFIAKNRHEIHHKKPSNKAQKEFFKAAYYLGVILKKYTLKEINQILGVQSL